MATSTVIDSKLARKQFTTSEFTIAAGKSASVNFGSTTTLNIPGYTVIGWYVSGGSNVDVRGSILAYTLNWSSANIKLMNTGTSSVTGTLSVYLIYSREIITL